MPINRTIAGAVALSLGLGVTACGQMPTNKSLYSTKQPVVERTNYTLDVRSGAGGLTIPERQRLAAWFDSLNLRYGDRVSIEDPMMSAATRTDVAAIASRYGILVSEGAPVTVGFVDPGSSRVVVTRSSASVPGCPDWSEQSDMNYLNATSPGYGCSTNGNLAAMVASPEDLIHGQAGTGETVVMSSTKAIDTYRDQAPTGTQGLKSAGTSGGN